MFSWLRNLSVVVSQYLKKLDCCSFLRYNLKIKQTIYRDDHILLWTLYLFLDQPCIAWALKHLLGKVLDSSTSLVRQVRHRKWRLQIWKRSSSEASYSGEVVGIRGNKENLTYLWTLSLVENDSRYLRILKTCWWNVSGLVSGRN